MASGLVWRSSEVMYALFSLVPSDLLHFPIVSKSITVEDIAVFQMFTVGYYHWLNNSGNSILFGFVFIANR